MENLDTCALKLGVGSTSRVAGVTQSLFNWQKGYYWFKCFFARPCIATLHLIFKLDLQI